MTLRKLEKTSRSAAFILTPDVRENENINTRIQVHKLKIWFSNKYFVINCKIYREKNTIIAK